MMVLGLVIHSAVSFTAAPLGAAWPYQDSATSPFFDVVVFFIHVFRMPLFFLMAGFFAAFLHERRGTAALVRNRIERVVLPFLAFLIILFPLTVSGFTFTSSGGSNGGWPAALAYLSNPAGWFAELSTIHLWFLYYLVLFYAAIAVLGWVGQRVDAAPLVDRARQLGRYIHHPVGFLGCSLVTFVTLLPMTSKGLDTETTFLVQPKILLAYGVFVAFGWLLYLNREHVDGFARRAWWLTSAGVVSSAAYLALALGESTPVLATKAAAALAMWTLIYGFIGLFVRYYDRPHPFGRYLADASYWLYLVHLPLTIWLPGLMNGWAVSAFVKSGLTLSATTLVTLATYHLFVRSSAVGAFLSGHRYSRALPRFDDAGHLLPVPGRQTTART